MKTIDLKNKIKLENGEYNACIIIHKKTGQAYLKTKKK